MLGRHDAADVVFDDTSVSRVHGVISRADAGVVYEEYGSQNGTRRGKPGHDENLPPRTPIAMWADDVIALGPESRVVFLAAMPERDRHRREAGTEESAAAQEFAQRLRLAARTRVPVFLLGDSGVGKTHSARRLHELSRLPGPFVPVNCARLPTEPTALHSELLGHVRGAYTGAEAARVGKLVLADGGTLFLDEVESLPPVAQGFLLDVLEGSGDLAPLGAAGTRLKPIAFRLISASKRPLATSGLRSDLCERLAEGHLWRVPGLADRVDDIPGLLLRFASEQAALLGVDVDVSANAINYARSAAWPGQVRMLRATIVALAQLGLARRLESGEGPGVVHIDQADVARHLRERGDVFGAFLEGDQPPTPGFSGHDLRRRGSEVPLDAFSPPQRGDARRLTQAQAKAALAEASGNLTAAARSLGVARNTLRKKLEG